MSRKPGAIHWADPLQSLLLLSEDPITRRLGSKVSAIYGSFVSGDTKGLLEGMGRHNDTSPLTSEQARTLYQMFEDLRQESPIRRTNAARVIADMIERIPEPPAQQLLGALCREISDTPDLRSQLGPIRIGMILSRASGVDQQVVASRLVDDALTSGKEMSLRLESLETVSLEEAIEMVRITAPLVLSVRTEQGLEPSAEKTLLDWLVDRTIVVKSKSFQLPFNELEQWLHEYQDSLSSALGIRYLSALADELEKADPATFDITAAAGRASRIFIELLPIGEETRRNLWKLLVRYVGLSQADAVRTAWEVTARNLDKATDGEVSDFVTTFVERIKKFPDDGLWGIDREEAAAPLLDIVAARLGALDGTVTSALAGLADQWSREPALATLSCEIVKQLRMRDVAAASRVLDAWAPLIISTLPIECVKFLATSFPTLQGNTQTAVASAFSIILNNEQLSDDINKRYEAFVKTAPSSSWEVEPLRGYLDKLLQQIAVRYNNPSSYLYAVIPNTVGLLKHATSSVLGTSLQQLFSQAKTTPKHYSWLHHWMTGNWPVRSDALTSYDPQLIFDEAHTFALTQAAASTKGILRSMADMLERELVPAGNYPKLIEAACSIWAAAPQHALDTFTSERAALSADQAANLLTPIDWSNQDHISALQSAWSNITKLMIDQARVDTSMMILAKGPIGTEAEPDLALRTWLEAQSDSGTVLLTSLITSQNIGDAHRSRLWKQAVSRARILGSKFFLEVVPRIVVMPSIDETATAIFDDHETISEALGDTDNRSEMAQSLMSAFTEAKTNTIKGRIAAYCNRLTGNGALKQFKPNELNKSDIEFLETHFGGSPELRRLRKLVLEN